MPPGVKRSTDWTPPTVVRQRQKRVAEIRRALDGSGVSLARSDTPAAVEIQGVIAGIRGESGPAIEEGLAFLAANPFCWHSGYVREKLLSAIRQARLNEEQREWMRGVLVEAIMAGPHQGLRAIANTAVGLDSPEFRERVWQIRDDRRQRTDVRWVAHHVHRSLLDPNAPKSMPRWGDGNRRISDPSWQG